MSTAEEAPAAPTAKRPDHENEVLPWSVVFAFASGSDAANAMATTKSTSRGTLFSDDDVTAGLNLRLEKSEAGKMILNQLSSPPKGRFWLPKLMYCADNKFYCRTDGIFSFIPINEGYSDNRYYSYLRFFSDCDNDLKVVRISLGGTPDRVWRWLENQRGKTFPRDKVQFEWMQSGPNLAKVSFTPSLVRTRHDGYLRSDGILSFNVDSIAGQVEKKIYKFMPVCDGMVGWANDSHPI